MKSISCGQQQKLCLQAHEENVKTCHDYTSVMFEVSVNFQGVELEKTKFH